MKSEVINLTLPDYEKVTGVGYLYQKSVKETYQLHTHDFYEIFYIIKGKAIHEINYEKQVLRQGMLVFIRPEDVHQYTFINNYDFEILSIGIECEVVEYVCDYLEISLMQMHRSKLPPMIMQDGAHSWNMKDKLMMINTKERGVERRKYFLSIFPEIIYQLYYNSKYQNEIVIPVWLSDIIEEMEKKDNFLLGLSRMIELSNVSQEHLTREFKRFLGITPTEFINIKRVNYGVELLLQRKYSILETCYMCGFNNLSYFYKVFDKTYHCTPKEFLKFHLKS
ncbi:MAG: AraC family transcriptional regulator [Clostridiales bacterium]|nr:AraC family transcriptional regulator [Clostridiales bacterium]